MICALRAAATVAVVIAISGCVTVPRVATTPTGNPEVTISGVDLATVSSALVSEMTARQFVLENQTTNSLFFTREMKGGQAIAAQLLIGNSYSTTPKSEIRYMLSSESGGVHVIASSSMSTQMAFGQTHRQDMHDNNNWFNEIYQLLQSVKSKVERPVQAQSASGQQANTTLAYNASSGTWAPADKPVFRAAAAIDARPDIIEPLVDDNEHYRKALALFDEKKYDEASKMFDEHLSLYKDSPNTANAMYWKAHCAFRSGDFVHAAAGFDDVVAKYPTSEKVPAAIHNGAIAYSRLGKNDRAIELFEKLLAEHPGDPMTNGVPEKIQQLKNK